MSPVPKARAVTRLRNGGILIELASDDAAAWFAHGEIHQNFLMKLHPGASAKPQGYHVVVQFIPLTFRPDKEVDLREIEEVNGMNKATSFVPGGSNQWPGGLHRRHVAMGSSPSPHPRWPTTFSSAAYLSVTRNSTLKSVSGSPCAVSSAMGGVTWRVAARLRSTHVAPAHSTTRWMHALTWPGRTASPAVWQGTQAGTEAAWYFNANAMSLTTEWRTTASPISPWPRPGLR